MGHGSVDGTRGCGCSQEVNLVVEEILGCWSGWECGRSVVVEWELCGNSLKYRK